MANTLFQKDSILHRFSGNLSGYDYINPAIYNSILAEIISTFNIHFRGHEMANQVDLGSLDLDQEMVFLDLEELDDSQKVFWTILKAKGVVTGKHTHECYFNSEGILLLKNLHIDGVIKFGDQFKLTSTNEDTEETIIISEQ